MKLAVIGAGSTYSPEIFDGLLKRKDVLPFTRVSLMDIDARKLTIVGGLIKRMLNEHGLDFVDCTLTSDLDEALSGANYVIAQVRVGQLDARILDEKIPLKHGLIGQETTGIGGFFKALRTIPVIVNVAQKIEKLCPDAWFINFSNPSGMIAQAVQTVSPIKMVGLCNGPFGLRAACRKQLSDPDAQIEVVGLNHFNWTTRVLSHGGDALDGLLDAPRFEFPPEMIRLVGGIPSGYLNYFYHRSERLHKLENAPMTRGEECKIIEEDLLKMYAQPTLNEKPALLDKRGGALYSEAAVSLIEAIELDKHERHIVNVKNDGALPFLADDDVIEVASSVSKSGITPLKPAKLPDSSAVALIQAVKAYERLGVTAALNGSRDDALRALSCHPMVGDMDIAAACFDELLDAHRAYLPQF